MNFSTFYVITRKAYLLQLCPPPPLILKGLFTQAIFASIVSGILSFGRCEWVDVSKIFTPSSDAQHIY